MRYQHHVATIEINNLACSRRDNVLFEDISFSVTDGDLLQIDGINGSGKSTMLRIIAGLTEPGAGDVLWNKRSIHACRYEYQQQMTYLGHNNGVKDALTVEENLVVMQALSGRNMQPDFDGVLRTVGLPGLNDVMLGKMSAGQKRRMGLSRLLLDQSLVWLLDEPFTSLDISGKKIIEDLIVAHCHHGGIVIFATHQEMEIEGQNVRHIHLGKQRS